MSNDEKKGWRISFSKYTMEDITLVTVEGDTRKGVEEIFDNRIEKLSNIGKKKDVDLEYIG